MSLDQNLFTLFLTPNTSGEPAGTVVVDLVDPAGKVHYRKRRIFSQQPQVYRIEVSDPLSEALLAGATAPSATSKHKTVELYNPSKVVELKHTGTLIFRWSFKWETHEFEWKREECFIIRKPDPPVLVAVTKEPPGRIRTASVQILDYNLNRFDIEDRKGLEIVILTALLTFQDLSDTYHEPSTSAATPSTASASVGRKTLVSAPASPPPPPPPKPAPKKGVARIAELQSGRGQVNEVTVLEEGTVADYAKHCAQLLQDEAMLFISVRSSDLNQVPKVLHVVEETKRLRYKGGHPDLHQYVVYDTKEGVAGLKGPRVINLDDDDGKRKNTEYSPPESLTVHVSKIDMPELRPRGAVRDRKQTTGQDKGDEKGKVKELSRQETKENGRMKPTPPIPRRSTSPPHPHVPVLHKYRSQYFAPTTRTRTTVLSPPAREPPPLPPRTHPTRLHRQSMYGTLNTVDDGHGVQDEVTSTGNGAAMSGSLGRFLG